MDILSTDSEVSSVSMLEFELEVDTIPIKYDLSEASRTESTEENSSGERSQSTSSTSDQKQSLPAQIAIIPSTSTAGINASAATTPTTTSPNPPPPFSPPPSSTTNTAGTPAENSLHLPPPPAHQILRSQSHPEYRPPTAHHPLHPRPHQHVLTHSNSEDTPGGVTSSAKKHNLKYFNPEDFALAQKSYQNQSQPAWELNPSQYQLKHKNSEQQQFQLGNHQHYHSHQQQQQHQQLQQQQLQQPQKGDDKLRLSVFKNGPMPPAGSIPSPSIPAGTKALLTAGTTSPAGNKAPLSSLDRLRPSCRTSHRSSRMQQLHISLDQLSLQQQQDSGRESQSYSSPSYTPISDSISSNHHDVSSGYLNDYTDFDVTSVSVSGGDVKHHQRRNSLDTVDTNLTVEEDHYAAFDRYPKMSDLERVPWGNKRY